jgi:hypothetical protein
VSDTPRTDGLKFLPANAIMSGLPVVYADFAHQLERELASVTAERNALLADKERLDWLLKNWPFLPMGINTSRAAIDAAKGGQSE